MRIHAAGAMMVAAWMLVAAPASAVTIFSYHFDQPDSSAVGGAWKGFEGVPNAIDASKFRGLVLSYDWAAGDLGAVANQLHVIWKSTIDSVWTELAAHGLGGISFAGNSVELGSAADGQKLQLAFWANVSSHKEAARLCRVERDGTPIPEPMSVALFGLGTLVVGQAIRRRR